MLPWLALLSVMAQGGRWHISGKRDYTGVRDGALHPPRGDAGH